MTKYLISFAALLIATATALGIWFPRFRMRWRGTNKTLGPLSCLESALFFGCLGVAGPWAKSLPRFCVIALVLCAISGWILMAISGANDVRGYSRRAVRASCPPLPNANAPVKKSHLLLAGFGIFFLLLVIYFLASRK